MVIDTTDISTLGVTLLKSEGELTIPKIKRPLSYNWQDEDGLDIDLTTTDKEPREIELEFLLTATTPALYKSQLETFAALFTDSGLHDLEYDYLPTVIPIFLESDIMIQERLNPFSSDAISCKIKLTVTEPIYTKQIIES
jgi:hypothetical protein